MFILSVQQWRSIVQIGIALTILILFAHVVFGLPVYSEVGLIFLSLVLVYVGVMFLMFTRE